MKRNRFSVNLSTLSILSVAAAVITAVTVCIVIFSNMYNGTLIRDAHLSSEQAIDQAAIFVNGYFDSITAKLSSVSEIVSSAQLPSDITSGLSTFTQIQNDIYAVTVYDSDGNIVSCAGSGGKLKEHIKKDLSFDKELFNSSNGFAVSSPHVQTLFENEYPWVVTVAAPTEAQLANGGRYIAIDFNFSEIAKYINNIGIGRHGYCFIIDRNGEIVYHPQQQLIFSGLKDENTDRFSTMADGVFDTENTIYTLKTTGTNAWRIVGISYTDELAADGRLQIFVSIILSFIFCCIIMLIVLAIYSKNVNAPVRALIRAMKRFETETDNFEFENKSHSVNEINVLSNSFEHMYGRIQNLMEQIRIEEKELRKTELKALQAQINPHFLYNTLDSIQWMCEQGKTESAAKMVSALARLFRISISRGHELIPIRDELLHAKNYLIIQSFRYRDQFTYSFDTEPGLDNYLCNKITVQPLIENAIYHGIDRLVDEGEIKITVRTANDDENDILITVADNGVGMTEEQCRAILQKEHSDSRGIGVKNVSDRLKIYFGEKYGISIKSELDIGTEVIVRIPKIEKESDRYA